MRTDDAESVLRQLLGALPYLTRSARVRADEVSAILQIPLESLKQLLSILDFCGLPPYGGGDTFNCVIEGGRISLSAPLPTFRRPVRLSTNERAALAIGLSVVSQLGASRAPALKRAMEKVQACLSSAAGALDGAPESIQPTQSFPEQRDYLSRLVAAMEKRARVSLEYYSLNSDALTQRVVEPIRLEAARGRWYLLARCLLRHRVVHFRLDRIRSIQPAPTPVARRIVVREARAPYEIAGAEQVTLRVAPEVARDWQERERAFLVSVGPTTGQTTEVVITTSSAPWLTRLVLRYGGKVEVLAPQHMRRAVAQAATVALQHYQAQAKETRHDAQST